MADGEDKVGRVPHPTQPVRSRSLRARRGIATLAAVRLRRWFLAGAAAVVLVGGLTIAREWYLSRAPRLGPLDATPAASQLSVRVGETVRFRARADGAVGFTWLRWGRPVAAEGTWTYVAAPEDAGWQRIAVEVTGRRGLRLTRTWEVGVVAAVAPEIDVLTPAAGPIAVRPGEKATFRARAHLPGGRADDRLAFEWALDDRPFLRDERSADDAESEVVLPAASPGTYRLRLRVTEDGRTASLADWAIAVQGGDAEAVRTATRPPVDVPPAPAPPAAESPRLVPSPGPRELDAELGRSVPFEARVAPEVPGVTYRWTVDEDPAGDGGSRFDYRATERGPHEVVVVAELDGRRIGRDAWMLMVYPPEVTTPPPDAGPRIVRAPGSRRLEGAVGDRLAFATRVRPETPDVVYRWSVDGTPAGRPQSGALEYEANAAGRHKIAVTVELAGRAIGNDAWVVDVRAPEAAPIPPPASPPPTAAAAPASTLVEADLRHWLADYARAWSRKDVAALQRMGQVRGDAEAAQLERYFASIGALDVDVRIVSLTVEGEHASVEFERTDTVTDPSGRRQQLRLPPIRKRIERTPDGFRFTPQGGRG